MLKEKRKKIYDKKDFYFEPPRKEEIDDLLLPNNIEQQVVAFLCKEYLTENNPEVLDNIKTDVFLAYEGWDEESKEKSLFLIKLRNHKFDTTVKSKQIKNKRSQNMTDIDNHKSLGHHLILGETYQLVVDDEGYYTLLDKDKDIEESSVELFYKGEDFQEKICEMYLHSNYLYGSNHPEYTCVQLINMLEKAYSKGKQDGRKEQLGFLIDVLEKDLENM